MKNWLWILLTPLCFIAGTAQAFSISPLKFDITVEAGASELVSVAIGNTDSKAHQYRLTTVPVTMDEKGHPHYGIASTAAASWIKFDQPMQTIAAQATKKITATIAPPADTEPGTQIAAIVVQEVVATNGTVGLSARVAMPLYITIAGTVTEALHITEWQSQQKIFSSFLWPVTLRVHNDGTVRVPLLGKVVVRDASNMVVTTTVINLGNQLFPGTDRVQSFVVTADNVQPFFPARFTVTVLVQYGVSKTILNDQLVVWVVPIGWWVIGGVVIVGIIALCTYLIFIKKKRFEP